MFVSELLRKFDATELVHNEKREEERLIKQEGNEIAVFGHPTTDGIQSTRPLSQEYLKLVFKKTLKSNDL